MIEAISPKDLTDIVNLRVKLFKEAGKFEESHEEQQMLITNKIYFKKLFAQQRFLGYIDRTDQQITSIALAVILDFPPVCQTNKGKTAHIFNVYTEEFCRKQGKSTNLLNALIKDLKTCNIDKIILDANEKSIPLYEKLGFHLQDKAMVLTL